MAGSTFGKQFTITTWGESHGSALGVVVDGCPAGLFLGEEDIQKYLNRRKPGQSNYTTPRKEDDTVEILSGIFNGQTTGTPISLLVRNTSQISKDYRELAHSYRPGHADYTFDQKYGIRDYRGGGRSSGRETIGRVAAGAIALKILTSLGIEVCAYTKSIGPVSIDETAFDKSAILETPTAMPDRAASLEAQRFLEDCLANRDSAGGVIECKVFGMPVGIGEPVFDKLDASLAKAIMSVGAVKAFEIGDGFETARSNGSKNNDSFIIEDNHVSKKTNHAGGILGGLSDGSPLILRAYIKPTPSIFKEQETVTDSLEEVTIAIKGRHDPIIVPRAVVVIEAMTALTILDLLYENMSSRMEYLRNFYSLTL